MAIDTTLESAVAAQRGALLRDLGAAGSASGQSSARQAAARAAGQALAGARDINTPTLPADPHRGRNLDIFV